jgi:hypothetical protein
MPVNEVPYDTSRSPERQLDDAFHFWRTMQLTFRVPCFLSRESLYCLNLAPARLRNGDYDDETVLYAAPGAAYRANALAFGLDPSDPAGALRMRHLAFGLDAAVRRCRARYDAELACVRELLACDAAAPDLRDPNLSEVSFTNL